MHLLVMAPCHNKLSLGTWSRTWMQ